MQKSSKKITISPDITSFQPNKSPLLSPTSISTSGIMASISAFSEKYKKLIESVIKIQESLYDSKMPQKCLPHNISYTLYCETDHKILCSRCMYQNNMHKLHTVKPLNQAVDMIGADCSKLEKEVERILQKLQEYLDYSQAQTTRIQRQYPPAKDKIEQLYKYLHQFLFDQEKQNIKTLRAYRAILTEQQKQLTKQILKTKNYVEEKINKYKGKFAQDEILTKKNVFAVLMNSEKIIMDQLKIDLKNKEEKYKFMNGLKQTTKEFFVDHLNKMFPWGKCKPIMKDLEGKKESQKKQNQSAEKDKKARRSGRKLKTNKTQSPQTNKGSPQKSSPEKGNELKNGGQSKVEVSPSPSKNVITKQGTPSRSSKTLFSSKSKKKILNMTNYQTRSHLMMKNSLLVQNQQSKSQTKRGQSKSQQKNKDKNNSTLKQENKTKLQSNLKPEVKNQKATKPQVSKQKQIIKLKK